ncbi:MAG: MerR family transcriptional regulator [Roseinatronobacter sp.]
MRKAPEAFRTISEAAHLLQVQAHVLRFWESKFPQVKPVKRAGGRRYYRPNDIALLAGIRFLLHDQGLTIRGVQKLIQEQGVRHVAGLGGPDVVAAVTSDPATSTSPEQPARPSAQPPAPPAVATPAEMVDAPAPTGQAQSAGAPLDPAPAPSSGAQAAPFSRDARTPRPGLQRPHMLAQALRRGAGPAADAQAQVAALVARIEALLARMRGLG